MEIPRQQKGLAAGDSLWAGLWPDERFEYLCI